MYGNLGIKGDKKQVAYFINGIVATMMYLKNNLKLDPYLTALKIFYGA